jgi:hypothetical protein
MQLPYRRILLALCGAFLALPAVHAASAVRRAANSPANDTSLRVYKFTDDHGVVHYGDSVPSEYSQSDRQVLNSQGVELSRTQGRQSDAQLSVEEQNARDAEQRAQHDRFLLQTYASADEIVRLRDERLDQIAGQIRASSSYIDSLGTRLAALQERAMHFEPYSSEPNAARMPDELAVELVRTVNESRLQRAALDTKRQAEDDMRVQFAADLQRYRELTSPHRSD